MSLIDHLKHIIKKQDKDYYDNLSDSEKKEFKIFMLQRFLSMNFNWLPFVNFINKYISTLTKEQYYKLITSLIPKQKRTFYKYVKNQNKGEYNKKALKYIKKYYKISKREAKDYYDILDKSDIKDIIKKYGIENKKIGNI